MQLLYITGRTW